MRNIKLTLEYDGTHYHGWQSQAGSGIPTIQETLEKAVSSITKEECSVYSSGRTDAGVHALGHVANFHTVSGIPAESWTPALNHLLPEDIKVLASEEVPENFHARYSASGKIYLYLILNRRASSALYRNHAWHIMGSLNLNSMRDAAATFTGKHDFSAFRSSACTAKTPVRSVKNVSITKDGDFIEVRLEADAFLMHMARNIVGTLVDVGLGKYTREDVELMLLSCDRRKAGRAAPARGLYLQEVFYA